jgi:hypothetical protein
LKGKVKLRYDVTEFTAHRLHLLPLAEILAGLWEVRQQKENGSEWRMILSGGQCSRTAEKFGASGDEPSSLSACFSGLRFVATDFSRWGKEWEGEIPAEPKRQRVASGE